MLYWCFSINMPELPRHPLCINACSNEIGFGPKPSQEGEMFSNLKTKMLIIMLLINGLAMAAETSDTMLFSITTNQFEISSEQLDNSVRYIIKGEPSLENPGSPDLPIKRLKLALPTGKKMVSIEVSAKQLKKLAAEVRHSSYVGDITTDFGERSNQCPPDPAVYGSDAFFPGEFSHLVMQGNLGPQPVIIVDVYPIQYRPLSGEVYLAEEIELSVKLIDDASKADLPLPHKASAFGKGMIGRGFSLDQPPQLGRGIPGGNPLGLGGEYLIITSAYLAPGFYPYLVWKNQKGILTELVLIEDILSAYQGVDNAAKLRAYLQEAFSNGARWVLFGGDEDVIPIRYAFQGNVTFQPSLADQQVCDLYFGDLTGDWDFDHDGVYGEVTNDHPDLIPELYVGRVPAATLEEASIWVEKATLYEQNPAHGDLSYLTKA